MFDGNWRSVNEKEEMRVQAHKKSLLMAKMFNGVLKNKQRSRDKLSEAKNLIAEY